MEINEEETTPIIIDRSISVDKGDLTANGQTIFLLDVVTLRYGWMPIRLDMYTIGSRYMLELRSPDKTVQINFRAWFGIGKKQRYDRFCALMDAVWDATVVRLVNEMNDTINEGGTIPVGRCNVRPEGIVYKDFLITWDDLSYQNNYNRLTLNSKSNASIWTNLYYTETENVHILRHFLDYKFANARSSAE